VVLSFYLSMAVKGTIDASKLFPEKLILKDVGNKNEPVNRDDLLNVDDKNWKSVLCRRCDSIIFPEDRVKLVDNLTVKLPLMSTSGTGCKETEDVSLWWYTASDMDFDTIGFAFEVYDNKKVLLCGDCEFGPVGLRSQDDKQFWVATERVVHVDKPPPPGAKPRPKKEKKKK
uniref:Mss4-like protein n=1 Tax=Haemonchus contortus TaxID=6289 RepID=A0A7I5E5B6_HAECO